MWAWCPDLSQLELVSNRGLSWETGIDRDLLNSTTWDCNSLLFYWVFSKPVWPISIVIINKIMWLCQWPMVPDGLVTQLNQFFRLNWNNECILSSQSLYQNRSARKGLVNYLLVPFPPDSGGTYKKRIAYGEGVVLQ